MDQTPSFQSEYLQTRLRETRAESTRSAKQLSRSARESKRQPQGRDDEIFDPDDSPTARKTAGRLYQTTPPSSYTHDDRERPSSRKGSVAPTASSSTARSLGAREMEEHVDKLSKQNFDLKLEVFHRRTKIEELEKKLRDYPKLEESNAELMQMNEELVQELEKRDRAVDEAVVMICSLEEKVRALEAELFDAVHSNSSRSRGTEARVIKEDVKRSKTLSEESGERRPRRKIVSPDVSARIAGLAAPTDKDGKLLPSFLSKNEPSTDALRSIYMEGNKIVRPIPSEASLLSRETFKDEDNAIDEALNSPRLSVLSMTDLKSLYGKDDSQDVRPQKIEEEPMPQPRSDDISIEGRRARTNRWVTDRANSPTKQKRNMRSTSPDVGQFQSLGGVLQREDSRSETSSGRLHRRQGPLPQLMKDHTTSGLTGNPIFGQNIFPPTPDTMVTRPSNHSTSSFLQDKNQLEGISHLAQNAAMNQTNPTTMSRSLEVSGKASSKSTLSPQGFEAFDDPRIPDRETSNVDAQGDFGTALFRHDSNESDTPRVHHYSAMDAWASLGTSGAPPPAFAPSRSSTSPPRFFNSRRRSAEFTSPPFSTSKPQQLYHPLNTSPERERGVYRGNVDGAIPADPASFYDPQWQEDQVTAPSSYKPPPQLARSNTTSAQSTSSKASRLQARSASLRQRVARITRRNSSSSAAIEGTDDESTPAPTRRSGSITRHFRLRRNSTSTNASEAPANNQTDDEGKRGSRRNSFRSAIAPLLGLDGPSNKIETPPVLSIPPPSAMPPRSAGSGRSGTVTSSDGKSFHSMSSGGSMPYAGNYGTISYAESGAQPVNFDPTTRRPSTSRRTGSRGSAVTTTTAPTSPPTAFPRRGQDGQIAGMRVSMDSSSGGGGGGGRSKSFTRR